jgi:hypothetical protein
MDIEAGRPVTGYGEDTRPEHKARGYGKRVSDRAVSGNRYSKLKTGVKCFFMGESATVDRRNGNGLG